MVEICSHKKKEDFPEFVDVWNKEHACLTVGPSARFLVMDVQTCDIRTYADDSLSTARAIVKIMQKF
jgi:hypothetical protein